MKETYRIYVTNWIFGIGRGVVLTTQQRLDGKLISEAFTFTLDAAPEDKFFCPRLITHTPLSDKSEPKIDLEFMEEEAKQQGLSTLEALRWRKYQKTKDKELLKNRITLNKADDRQPLVSLKVNGNYVSELERVRDVTVCVALKDYLRFILDIKIEIVDL